MVTRKSSRRWILAVSTAILAFAVWAAPVGAKGPIDGNSKVDSHLFKPAVDSKGLFTVNATPILPHLGISFGLIIDYANSIMRLPPDSNLKYQKGPSLLDHSVWGTLHFNLGIKNFMVLGLQLPIGVVGGPAMSNLEDDGTVTPGDASISGGSFLNGWDGQGLGNLAIHAKFRFLRVELMPVGVAAIVQIGLPTVAAKNPSFLGDDYGYLVVQGVLDKWFGRRVKMAVNVGAKLNFGALAGKTQMLRLESSPND